MEKATSNSICVFCSGFLLLPQPQQHSYSEFVTADASLAPVNSDVALLCEPSQAWFIIPVHQLDTAHSCLNAISSWDVSFLPSLPLPTLGYQPHPHSLISSLRPGQMTLKYSGTWGSQACVPLAQVRQVAQFYLFYGQFPSPFSVSLQHNLGSECDTKQARAAGQPRPFCVSKLWDRIVKVWRLPKGILLSETCIFNRLYLTSMMGKLLSHLTASGMRKWKNTLKVDISWQIREKFNGLKAIEKEMQIKIWCFYLSAYSGEAINNSE